MYVIDITGNGSFRLLCFAGFPSTQWSWSKKIEKLKTTLGYILKMYWKHTLN